MNTPTTCGSEDRTAKPEPADAPYNSTDAARTARIRALNDALRRDFAGGRVLMTNGIDALGDETASRVLDAIRGFEEFNEDNDPFGLHDCALMDVEGVAEKVMFKIDAYDRRLECHSPDEADPAVTTRVMTVLLASEY